MSTSTREGPGPLDGAIYPPTLLKQLLKQIMIQFAARGGCIALFDEKNGHMCVHMHLRMRGSGNSRSPVRPPGRQWQQQESIISVPAHNSFGRMHHLIPAVPEPTVDDEVEEVSAQSSQLFAPGTCYAPGNDLIGYAWSINDICTISYDEYLQRFHQDQASPTFQDIRPSHLMAIPIRETTLKLEACSEKTATDLLGVVVLYRTNTFGTGFYNRPRSDVLLAAERIALYLQNEQLCQAQARNRTYLQRLKEISAAFPSTVRLAELVHTVYEFTKNVVDSSSMLFTIYDRDKKMIYDVFAVNNGKEIVGLMEKPRAASKEERPVWWNITQQMAAGKLQMLLFSPKEDVQQSNACQELLSGSWGDQSQAGTFLFLPLRMFNRVIGSLSITSMKRDAYHEQEIQVLETMVQIVTVSIENANLYQRDREVLQKTKVREEQLAALNNLWQIASSTLDLKELLTSLVKWVALIGNADLCVFFQLAPSGDELVAKAMYMRGGQSSLNIYEEDDSGRPAMLEQEDKHDDLIEQVRLPFKGTALQNHWEADNFFYLDQAQLEELARHSVEATSIFLAETQVQQLLMIPVSYNHELQGMLALSTPKGGAAFQSLVIGTLQAASSQAASAIHRVQLFEQRALAYAELERLSKLKDEFLVTASHELRTPLTAITGYTSQLKRQLTRMNPQQISRTVERIAGAAQQLSDMVANITEAAKMGALDEKLDLQMGPVLLSAAVEMAINLLSVNVDQRILHEVPADIWVHGDALRIRQVISNLLDNAAKYSPPGSTIYLYAELMTLQEVRELIPDHHPDIGQLQTRAHEQVVVVRVRDQGEGVQPEDAQRIFEKFVRATRSLTTPVRGSGLGLFICRRYISAMNGWLWLEASVPGKGSTFSFYLPTIEPPQEVGRERQDAQA
jgi:signal transduction histidine kinase